jgi:hypothetical protein
VDRAFSGPPRGRSLKRARGGGHTQSMKSNKICNFANLTRAQINHKELELKKTLQVSDYFAPDILYQTRNWFVTCSSQ